MSIQQVFTFLLQSIKSLESGLDNYFSRESHYCNLQERLTNGNKLLRVKIPLRESPNSLYEVYVYRLSGGSHWEKLKIERRDSDMVSVNTSEGGYFVVTKHIESAFLAGIGFIFTYG